VALDGDEEDVRVSTKENPIIWKRYVFMFTDGKDQGHQVVTAARIKLKDYDKEKCGVIWKLLEEWSDGCGDQFRCTGALMDLIRLVHLGHVDKVYKCFHCPSHGKTEGDGAGGQKKRLVYWLMVEGGVYCKDAAGIVKMLEDHEYKDRSGVKPSTYLSRIKERNVDEHLNLLLTEEEIQEVEKLNGKPGHMAIMSNDEYRMCSGTPWKLEVRKRSCRCGCLEGGECEYEETVGKFVTHDIVPKDAPTERVTRAAVDDVRVEVGQLIEVDDVVMVEHQDQPLQVLGKEQFYDYYLLVATHKAFQVTKEMISSGTCPIPNTSCHNRKYLRGEYDNDFLEGDWVVGGRWLVQSTLDPDPLTLFEVPQKYGMVMVNTVRNPSVHIERGTVTTENQGLFSNDDDADDEVPLGMRRGEVLGKARYVLSQEQHEALLDDLAENS